ncbi:MAG: iron uptake porin [Cyanobacteria bacterium P01_G01_bin.39]
MNVLKTQRHHSSFNLSRSPFLWFLPFTLLPISIDQALASESEAMSQINNVRQLKSRQSPNILEPSNKISQITNVQQLRDISPTDWAYEALRSLVDRYSCISGFGDQTYRGSQPLSRYEFAAGLNSCLNQIERLIASSKGVSQADLKTAQRLSQEFEAELATIGGRVEGIESRTAIIEDNQFSTTTKLLGNLFVNITGATADGDIDVETNNLEAPLTIRPAARDDNNDSIISTVEDDPEITYSYYTWLNFNSSFSGRDNLAVQLVAGNATSPANTYISAGLFNTFGTPFTDQTGAPEADDVAIRELFYDFPIGDRLRVVVGPRINWYRYFDNNAYSFFLTGAGSFNSSGGTLVNPIDRGSGAVITYAVNDSIDLKVGYLGENTEFLPAAFFNTSSDPEEGLFSATQTLTAEIDFAIANQANIRLMYTRSTVDNNVPIFDADGNITGFGIGGATGEPIYGVADDGFGGTIGDAPGDTVSVNFDWRILDEFGIFGRYNFGSTSIRPTTPGIEDGNVDAQAFQFGVAFPDLAKEGALGTLSFVVPFDVIDGEEFLVSGGGDGGTQFEFEATYYFPLNFNLAAVPAFYLIANPNNFEDNPNIYVGNLRMQFTF